MGRPVRKRISLPQCRCLRRVCRLVAAERGKKEHGPTMLKKVKLKVSSMIKQTTPVSVDSTVSTDEISARLAVGSLFGDGSDVCACASRRLVDVLVPEDCDCLPRALVSVLNLLSFLRPRPPGRWPPCPWLSCQPATRPLQPPRRWQRPMWSSNQ